jgi:UrcA family protein
LPKVRPPADRRRYTLFETALRLKSYRYRRRIMLNPAKLIFAAGIAITAGASFADALEPRAVRVNSLTVNYSDLDLRKEDHVQVMLRRLERAAFEACGGDERPYPGYNWRPERITEVFRECRAGAVARAVATVNSENLWLAYRAE